MFGRETPIQNLASFFGCLLCSAGINNSYPKVGLWSGYEYGTQLSALLLVVWIVKAFH